MALGAAVGAGSGALQGRAVDYGINDDFIKKLGATSPADFVRPLRADQAFDTGQGASGDRAVQAAGAEDLAVQRGGSQIESGPHCSGVKPDSAFAPETTNKANR